MRQAFTLAAIAYIATLALAKPATTRKCTKPYTRKEWRELSPREQGKFIEAVKCLGNKPHSAALKPTNFTSGIVEVNPNSSLYDDFVYAHMDTNVKDHFTGLFLPWHRWYLTAFETALRKKCEYGGALPYWDWSLDVADVPASPVFSSDPKIGFGRFGTSSNNYTITDGAFSNVIRAYPDPHVLARNWSPQPFLNKIFPLDFKNSTKFAVEAFTPGEVKYIIEHFVGDYVGFAYYLDGVRAQGMHNAAHLMMLPGDISNPSYSPNDPLFYLHHANLDRIWASWQKEDTRNANAYGGGSIQNLPDYDNFPVGQPPYVNTSWTLPTSGLENSDPTVAQVMSTTGGYLCFNYSKYKV